MHIYTFDFTLYHMRVPISFPIYWLTPWQWLHPSLYCSTNSYHLHSLLSLSLSHRCLTNTTKQNNGTVSEQTVDRSNISWVTTPIYSLNNVFNLNCFVKKKKTLGTYKFFFSGSPIFLGTLKRTKMGHLALLCEFTLIWEGDICAIHSKKDSN